MLINLLKYRALYWEDVVEVVGEEVLWRLGKVRKLCRLLCKVQLIALDFSQLHPAVVNVEVADINLVAAEEEHEDLIDTALKNNLLVLKRFLVEVAQHKLKPLRPQAGGHFSDLLLVEDDHERLISAVEVSHLQLGH